MFLENAQPNKQNDSPVVTGYQCKRLRPAQDWCQSYLHEILFEKPSESFIESNRFIASEGVVCKIHARISGEAENLKNAIPHEARFEFKPFNHVRKAIRESKCTICSLYFMIFLLYIFVIHILLHKFHLMFFCFFFHQSIILFRYSQDCMYLDELVGNFIYIFEQPKLSRQQLFLFLNYQYVAVFYCIAVVCVCVVRVHACVGVYVFVWLCVYRCLCVREREIERAAYTQYIFTYFLYFTIHKFNV